jgi:hypothetical protein
MLARIQQCATHLVGQTSYLIGLFLEHFSDLQTILLDKHNFLDSTLSGA